MAAVKTVQPSLPGIPTPDLEPVSGPDEIGGVEIKYQSVREILTRATGFMEEYDYTLNPYSGCFFGCTYCYAAFFSRSAELRDLWGNWVTVKENGPEVLASRKVGNLDGKRIYMSSVTDPYQPIERQIGLTRRLLEVLVERHKPKLVVQTRSPDVVRDCDLFSAIQDKGGRVQVNMTVTTDDEDIRRTFEPSCPSNMARIRAIGEVAAQGIDTCITLTPLLLVRDPDQFADDLLETGVTKFIVQPFHFNKGKFVASTRDDASKLMADKLDCSIGSFKERYLEHYAAVEQVLESRLPSLGKGKGGFSPPF